jgi:hypothetical protein
MTFVRGPAMGVTGHAFAVFRCVMPVKRLQAAFRSTGAMDVGAPLHGAVLRPGPVPADIEWNNMLAPTMLRVKLWTVRGLLMIIFSVVVLVVALIPAFVRLVLLQPCVYANLQSVSSVFAAGIVLLPAVASSLLWRLVFVVADQVLEGVLQPATAAQASAGRLWLLITTALSFAVAPFAADGVSTLFLGGGGSLSQDKELTNVLLMDWEVRSVLSGFVLQQAFFAIGLGLLRPSEWLLYFWRRCRYGRSDFRLAPSERRFPFEERVLQLVLLVIVGPLTQAHPLYSLCAFAALLVLFFGDRYMLLACFQAYVGASQAQHLTAAAAGKLLTVLPILCITFGASSLFTYNLTPSALPMPLYLVAPLSILYGVVLAAVAVAMLLFGRRDRLAAAALSVARSHELEQSLLQGSGPDTALLLRLYQVPSTVAVRAAESMGVRQMTDDHSQQDARTYHSLLDVL